MSRGMKLLILVLILALTGFGAWYALGHKQEEPAEDDPAQAQTETEETVSVFSVDLDTVTGFSWTCLNRSGAVTRDGENWVYVDADGNKQTADKTIMDKLTLEISDVQAKRVLENVTDMSGYGFDDPICEIHIDTTSGSHDLVFGDPAKSDSETYYFTTGDGRVCLVGGTMSSDFFYRNEDLAPKAE